MVRIVRLAAFVLAVAVGSTALPAAAVTYIPPKLISRANTSLDIAGSGQVVVQVEVFPNGTHKVTHVIRSSNTADNAAALDIAARSTYRPALRDGKPVLAFYDFTIKFVGKGVASGGTGSSGSSARINSLIRAHSYASAKALIVKGLAAHPNDATLNEQLAAVDYYTNNYTGAAAAFDKVSSISRVFLPVAAQAYVMAALSLATHGGDSTQAVQYGQRAVAIQASANSYYALGTAELQAGDASSAVTDLKKAYNMMSSDPKADKHTRQLLGAQLMTAYQRNGDTAAANTLFNEVIQLDPTSETAKILSGNHYLAMGQTAATAGKHEEAIADFMQAATVGNAAVQVTAYASAAFEENKILQTQKTQPTVADYAKVKAYADKALAIKADDPLANFAEGVALAGEWATGGRKSASLKSQAMDALNKGKAEAQAAGNFALSLNIDNFIKATFK